MTHHQATLRDRLAKVAIRSFIHSFIYSSVAFFPCSMGAHIIKSSWHTSHELCETKSVGKETLESTHL